MVFPWRNISFFTAVVYSIGLILSKSIRGAVAVDQQYYYYYLPLSEEEVLQKLYLSTNGRQWAKATNWLSSAVHYCEWYGVTCSRKKGGITKIQLANNNMIGTIPMEVFQLPELRIVTFNDNRGLSFQSAIDDNISGNRNNSSAIRPPVEILKLERTAIGRSINDILNLIPNFSTTLKSLFLSGNDFGGIEFPVQLTELPNLTQLYVSDCNLSGNLPTHIGQLKNLLVLDASNNYINGYIPITVGLLSNLIQLELSNNLLSGTLPAKSLGQLQNLEILSIVGPGTSQTTSTLDSSGVEYQKIPKRRTLITNGKLRAGITGSLPDFAYLTKLRELHLSNNHLTGSIPSSFLDGIKDISTSIKIDLENNQLTGVIPQSLLRFKALDLFIAENNIRRIPDSFCSKQQWMSGTVSLYGCEAIACPRNTYSTNGRRKDAAETCQPCGNGTMAPFIGSTSCMTFANPLEKLQWTESMILLDFYDATGGENWKIDTNWGQNTAKSLCTWYGITCDSQSGSVSSTAGIVKAIALQDNNLIGSPPQSLFDLQSLQTLILSGNTIDFKPSDYSGTSVLINLHLDNTPTSSLEGISFMAESLQTLRVGHAKLSGKIPQEIYNLRYLKDLRLNNNKLSGSITSEIGHLLRLQYLSFAGNKISGSIPTEIGKLADLIVLNFSENNLDGALPQEILALTRLETIDLSDWNNEGNGLKGHLPDFANNINLRNILLAGNSFSGSIPATFLNGVSNTYEDIEVDLRWNLLTGGIPKALERLEKVELLMAGNSLTGYIPEVLCSKKYWMKGKVSNFGCNAILCPAGTFSSIGRQITASDPCKACPESFVANYLGTMGSCEFVPERTRQKEREREILKTFYSWMGGTKWNRNDNWMDDSIDICQWYGISCKNNSDAVGWVEKLSFPKNNLSGKSPPAIFDLPELTSIDFSGNKIRFQFNGINRTKNLIDLNLAATLTENVTGLSSSNLLHLTLSHSKLRSYYFPEEILLLKSLQTLDLSACGLGGSLPDAIGDLVELKVLDLFGNEFTGQLPNTISNLRNIVNLTLSSNGFYGTLPEGFGSLLSLENLHLDNNAASENGGLFGPLPDFSGLLGIKNLYLAFNSFSGTIPTSFLGGGINVHLPVKVDLRWNQLRGTVPATLDKFDALEIYLSGNYLMGIDESLCSNSLWMKGAVANYGCDAILCPTGSYNALGRQAIDSTPCAPCESSFTAPYMGSVACMKRDEYQATERTALKLFYNATGGAHWYQQENWLTDIDVCNWYGVRCERGEVAGLNFEANNLTGTCPPIILELPFLEELNLSENDIVFNFDYIHMAKQLKQLHLKNTLTSVLHGIENATNLTVLNLAGNDLEQTIPDTLLELRLLRELDISSNKFQGTLSDKIINLQELEVFNCSENFINGSIPYQIGGLQRLRTLDLSNNKLTGTIPLSFLQLIHLEKLSLMNQTSKGGVGLGGHLPSFLSNQALKEIKLNGNSITGTIPSNFLHELDTSLVVSVDLRSNQLSGDLPNDLTRFDNLEILLADNKFTGIPRSYCSKSKWMNGKVGSYGCDAILCPANTYNAAAGRRESNESVCEECSSRPFTSGYLGALNCRSLDAKQRMILERIYNSSNGEMWHENTNWMSHVADPCDWYGISCNENGDVISINLENNNVQGVLSADIFDLPALVEINLSSNPISILFDGIENATNLQILYLDFTELKSLAGVGQAYHLQEIHSSFNDISGLLPDELSKLSGLRILDLSDNKISGQLPSFLGDLLSLETLRLKSNSLSGHLPIFSNLTNLTTLDLSYNSFSGSIPLYFLQSNNVSQSVFVDLSHNQFTGTVPSSLALMNRLSIHLQENRIEGLDDALCQKTDWLNNEVGLFGCDAILCPKGTFNDVGRQSTNDTPCVPCMETKYYGSTACSYRSSETTVSSSALKIVASSARSKFLWDTIGVENNGATTSLVAFAMVTGFLFFV